MSDVAEKAGIGRATLYKYFPSVQAILAACHRRHIEHHLAYLTQVRDQARNPERRLRAVLEAYGQINRRRAEHLQGAHGASLAALMHTDEEVAHAHRELHRLISDVLGEAVEAGCIRRDIPVDELASYCLHALAAGGAMPSDAAACRLVDIALDGLRTDK